MKVYLDACCVNRPFDDQNQERIRLESEAVIIILKHICANDWEWLSSEVLLIEVENIPNIERKNYIKNLLSQSQRTVSIQDNLTQRAKQLEKLGFKSFDAMHIASAEIGEADIFLTTDDQILKLAQRYTKELNIKISNPLTWLMEELQ